MADVLFVHGKQNNLIIRGTIHVQWPVISTILKVMEGEYGVENFCKSENIIFIEPNLSGPVSFFQVFQDFGHN